MTMTGSRKIELTARERAYLRGLLQAEWYAWAERRHARGPRYAELPGAQAMADQMFDNLRACGALMERLRDPWDEGETPDPAECRAYTPTSDETDGYPGDVDAIPPELASLPPDVLRWGMLSRNARALGCEILRMPLDALDGLIDYANRERLCADKHANARAAAERATDAACAELVEARAEIAALKAKR